MNLSSFFCKYIINISFSYCNYTQKDNSNINMHLKILDKYLVLLYSFEICIIFLTLKMLCFLEKNCNIISSDVEKHFPQKD